MITPDEHQLTEKQLNLIKSYDEEKLVLLDKINKINQIQNKIRLDSLKVKVNRWANKDTCCQEITGG